jgi:hypothetical protein
MKGGDSMVGAPTLRDRVIAEVQGRLKEIRARVNALGADSAEMAAITADMAHQIADYDPDDVPLTGFSLTRDISADQVEQVREVYAKLEEARATLDASGELHRAAR